MKKSIKLDTNNCFNNIKNKIDKAVKTLTGLYLSFFYSFYCLGIHVKFTGNAKVIWTTGAKDSKTTHSSREDYIDKTIILLGKGRSPVRREMQNDRHC